MGLAEPRKRTKIAHDPRNMAWMNSTESYGHRLMQQQGWRAGDALGARSKNDPYSTTDAAKVVVQYKDDVLGLGATLRSKDVAHQRTGFDAFQGLLGRLNAKSENEVKVVEKRLEDKKLAMFAQGRWGGMVFVPGGLLVQTDPYKQKLEWDRAAADQKDPSSADDLQQLDNIDASGETNQDDGKKAKAQSKAEKKQLKEEKRLRKEQKRLKKAAKEAKVLEDAGLPTPDSSSSNEDANHAGKKRKASSNRVVQTAPHTSIALKNGRHILRGKNITAKRAAFADMKGLDEIFMRKP